MKTYRKSANEARTYYVDWRDKLQAGELFSSSTFTTSLTEDAKDTGDRQTQVTLSGGTLGTLYEVTNTVVTSKGQTLERSFDVLIVDR